MRGIEPKLDFSIKKVHEKQLQLSRKIIFEDVLPAKIRLVAGVDAAYTNDVSIGAVTVLDYLSLQVVETETATCKTHLPYFPTLLAFRETQPAILSIKKLKLQPDIFLVDGHGFAHPYRCGFASYLGLAIRRPIVGVAKSRLIGEVKHSESGDVALLEHEGEVIGALVTKNQEFGSIYVSVGHMVSLETAIRIVKHCTRNSRIPEPILKAHQAATTEMRKFK